MSRRLSHQPTDPSEPGRRRGYGRGHAGSREAGPERVRPFRLGPAPAFWSGLSIGIGIVGLLLMTPGCSGGEGGEASDATAAQGAGNRDDGAASSFVWPDGAALPLLSIEIEGAGVEGRIEIELMPELAPNSVAHVLTLAREGFYDGTTFHRVIPGFMIQGGDPNSRDRDPSNDGHGGMRERVEDERSKAPFVRGVVAMANQGRPDSSGSQLFIMHDDNRALDGRYNVIGRVRTGMDVVDAIAEVETDTVGRWGPPDRPIENVVMARVEVSAPGAKPGLEAGLEPDSSQPRASMMDELATTDD